MQAAHTRHSNRHGVDQGRQTPHLPLLASYSRVYICGLGVREAERTIIFEDPFLGAELACAAASGGVIERWQKEPYECKLHRVLDLKCLAVVPSTFEHTRCMGVTPTPVHRGATRRVSSLCGSLVSHRPCLQSGGPMLSIMARRRYKTWAEKKREGK